MKTLSLGFTWQGFSSKGGGVAGREVGSGKLCENSPGQKKRSAGKETAPVQTVFSSGRVK